MVLGLFLRRSFGGGFDERGRVQESDGDHAVMARGEGQISGELQDALGAHEIGLKVRAQGIAAPGDTGNANAGFAEQGVVDGDRDRRGSRESLDYGAANHGKEGLRGEAVAREEAIVSRPIVELLAASGQQTGDGEASEAEEAAQRESLRAFGDALLGEGGEAFSPEVVEGGEDVGRVFFRTEAGG